ncbi:hypothetical protein BHM03_00033822 [Ensete ventricosum]|nr:hypothetical protein BHM03_00033822 [Ensete ventricosum]
MMNSSKRCYPLHSKCDSFPDVDSIVRPNSLYLEFPNEGYIAKKPTSHLHHLRKINHIIVDLVGAHFVIQPLPMAIGRMRYRACMPCDVSTNSECSAGGGVEWEEEAEARMAAGGSDQPCCSVMFWVYLMICLGLVMFAGLMSGLTLGLMSLSLVDLEVLVKAGKPKDQLNAGLFPSPSPLPSLSPRLFPSKILPVVKNQHLLLCTLLIGNSLAMEVSAAPLLSSVCPRIEEMNDMISMKVMEMI